MRILSFFLITLLLWGCGERAQEVVETRPLRLCFGSPVRTLDPRLGGESPSAHLIRMLFEGLMRYNENGVLSPAGAESYEVSDDLKTYIFHLRKTFWTDGMMVTAHDYEYAWKKSLNPETLSHGSQHFYFIKNAELSAEGKISVDELGVKALDDNTLRVELEYPASHFLSTLGSTLFSPIPKHIDKINPSWAHHLDNYLVSNGPFKLKKYQWGNQVIVEKNQIYWDKEQVKLSEIQIEFVENAMTALYLYEKNQIDLMGGPMSKLPLEALKNLKKDPNFRSVESTYVYWFFVNTRAFPFTNKKIRKALAYAIDRASLVNHIWGGGGQVATGVVAPCFQINHSPHFKDGSFDEAKKLFQEGMQELGLTKETFPEITISYPPEVEAFSRTAQIVQQYWQKALDIKVELKQSEWPVHFTSIQKGNYQIGLMGWTTFICDPIYMLQTFKHKSEMANMSRWENFEYQRLLDIANETLDLKGRNQAFIEAESLLMEEMPVIPLCFMNLEFLQRSELIGVNMPPSGEIDFKYASFSQ